MNERNRITSRREDNPPQPFSSLGRGGSESMDLKRAIMERFRLTSREADVAMRLVEGDSYKEAAARLGITVNTINAHVTEILRKAGVKSSRRLASVLLRDAAGHGSADA